MKFIAELLEIDSHEIGKMVGVFFKNFNSKNNIWVENNVVNLEIHFKSFDEVPSDILEQFMNFKISSFKYLSDSNIQRDKYSNKIVASLSSYNDSDTSKLICNFFKLCGQQDMISVCDGKIDIEMYFNVVPPEIVNMFEEYNVYFMKCFKYNEEAKEEELSDEIKCEKIEELLNVSTSYDDFLERVIKTLRLDVSREKKFRMLFPVLKDEMVTSNNIRVLTFRKVLKENGERLSLADNSYFDYHTKTGFKINMGDLLRLLVKSRDFKFSLKESSQEIIDDNSKKTSDVSITECFSNIPNFEEGLHNILTTTKDKKERAKKILVLMGLGEQKTSISIQIIEAVNISLKTEKLSFERILEESEFTYNSEIQLQLVISEFVNSFIHKFYPDTDVKAIDFLGYLKKLVIS